VGAIAPYEVIRDTREKVGQGWTFSKTESCKGTVVETMKTGDYTLRGFEKILCIERKGAISEFANNLTESRFERELERMQNFPVAILLLEFDYESLMTWPQSSTMSKFQQSTIRLSRWYLQQRFWKLKLQFPTIDFVFVGKWGHEVASCLFKRVIENYV
jgi:hypothetical protein